jgi:hypothetical protein
LRQKIDELIDGKKPRAKKYNNNPLKREVPSNRKVDTSDSSDQDEDPVELK